MKKLIHIALSTIILISVSGIVLAAPGDVGYRFLHKTVTTRLLTTSFTTAEVDSAALDFINAASFSFIAGPNHLNPSFSSHVAF